jgi:hypothetical protein
MTGVVVCTYHPSYAGKPNRTVVQVSLGNKMRPYLKSKMKINKNNAEGLVEWLKW